MNPEIKASEPLTRFQKRIVFTTYGSLGDLHPIVGVALEMKARGHNCIIATSGNYRQKIEALDLGFRSIRPEMPDANWKPELARRFMDLRRGGERFIRELLLPAVHETYDDVLAAAEGADLLVSHTLTFAAPLVAQKKGMPWASVLIAPYGFFSGYDPPVLQDAQFLAWVRFLGPAFNRPLFWLIKRRIRFWFKEWHELRAEIGLPPTSNQPLFEGQYSPSLVLALFSKHFAPKMPDWPRQTDVSGFVFYDQNEEAGMSPELLRFLDAGPPPIVFTLGSTAVQHAGDFYEHSALAAKKLGRRAVLVVGKDPRNRPKSLPDGVMTIDYVPYSTLFPRAAAIVHQGGIGTTGQALRSGRPMLVVPFAFDQPDNGFRTKRLGIGRAISLRRYDAVRAAAELQRLLENPEYSRRATEIGDKMRLENGVNAACDALEKLLQKSRTDGKIAH